MSEGARELYQPLINITSGLIRAATVMAGRPLPFQSASFGPSLSLPLPHRPTDATVTTGNGFVHTDMNKKRKKKKGGRKEGKTWRCILSWICVTALWSGS